MKKVVNLSYDRFLCVIFCFVLFHLSVLLNAQIRIHILFNASDSTSTIERNE